MLSSNECFSKQAARRRREEGATPLARFKPRQCRCHLELQPIAQASDAKFGPHTLPIPPAAQPRHVSRACNEHDHAQRCAPRHTDMHASRHSPCPIPAPSASMALRDGRGDTSGHEPALLPALPATAQARMV